MPAQFELIETLWNVNHIMNQCRCTKIHRINRNIVECKLFRIYTSVVLLIELIETLWNVNGYSRYPEAVRLLELIETLWNVNDELMDICLAQIRELIETLWNVNEAHKCYFRDGRKN